VCVWGGVLNSASRVGHSVEKNMPGLKGMLGQRQPKTAASASCSSHKKSQGCSQAGRFSRKAHPTQAHRRHRRRRRRRRRWKRARRAGGLRGGGGSGVWLESRRARAGAASDLRARRRTQLATQRLAQAGRTGRRAAGGQRRRKLVPLLLKVCSIVPLAVGLILLRGRKEGKKGAGCRQVGG
jgi:hypothetical protein